MNIISKYKKFMEQNIGNIIYKRTEKYEIDNTADFNVPKAESMSSFA